MRIERWEDHGRLVEGQLVTDVAGKLWQVHKYRTETWLCPFSDEYAFLMGGVRVSPVALGDDALFPLTTVRAMSEDGPGDRSQASPTCQYCLADSRYTPIASEGKRCPVCGASYSGPRRDAQFRVLVEAGLVTNDD